MTLCVLELVTRGLSVGSGDVGLVEADPELGWRLSVNHSGEMAGVTITTDSHGVRVAEGHTPSGQRHAGQVVWVLGDSFTFGWGLPSQHGAPN